MPVEAISRVPQCLNSVADWLSLAGSTPPPQFPQPSHKGPRIRATLHQSTGQQLIIHELLILSDRFHQGIGDRPTSNAKNLIHIFDKWMRIGVLP
ncbi:MAG: hypothetical protein F6J95_015865 [Leptolyngbya sp. SIO1E4]|nr:hypothetical protein [Leptolyngbya sp. SIO1E4]